MPKATEEITVKVGFTSNMNGYIQDYTEDVKFDGIHLGSWYESDMRGNDGITENLYRSQDKLIIHIKDWSNWQGSGTVYTLKSIEKSDLENGGRHWLLGKECGFTHPLTLSEALEK